MSKKRNRKTLQEFSNSALRKLPGEERSPEDEDTTDVEAAARISVTGVDTNDDGLMDGIEMGIPTDDPETPPSDQRTRDEHSKTPMVEIEIVHQTTKPDGQSGPFQTVEVFTANRVYVMDPAMICVKVVDRATSEEHVDHPFIGFRLVGGQHRNGTEMELSYPYPRPGTEAVFEQSDGTRASFSRTSTVSRVLLRLHVVTVSTENTVPTWTKVSGTLPGH